MSAIIYYESHKVAKKAKSSKGDDAKLSGLSQTRSDMLASCRSALTRFCDKDRGCVIGMWISVGVLCGFLFGMFGTALMVAAGNGDRAVMYHRDAASVTDEVPGEVSH